MPCEGGSSQKTIQNLPLLKRETKKVRTAKGSKGTKKYRQQLHEEEDASLLPVKLKDGMIIQIQKPNVSEEDMEQYNQDLETQIRDIHKGGQQGGQKSVHENIIHGGEGEFENYTGVKLDVTGNISDTDFIKSITKVLNDNNIKALFSILL